MYISIDLSEIFEDNDDYIFKLLNINLYDDIDHIVPATMKNIVF